MRRNNPLQKANDLTESSWRDRDAERQSYRKIKDGQRHGETAFQKAWDRDTKRPPSRKLGTEVRRRNRLLGTLGQRHGETAFQEAWDRDTVRPPSRKLGIETRRDRLLESLGQRHGETAFQKAWDRGQEEKPSCKKIQEDGGKRKSL